MPKSFYRSPRAAQSQLELWWRDPEDRAAERAMDDLLGHDVEAIAAQTGMERRRLNQQRETSDPDLRRQNWLRRLGRILGTVRELSGGDRARLLPALQLLADAAGFDLAERLAGNAEAESPLARILGHAMREAGEAIATAAAAAADGTITARELPSALRQIDEAIAALHGLRETFALRAQRPRAVTSLTRAGAALA